MDAKQVSQSIFVADASEIPVVATGDVGLDAVVEGESETQTGKKLKCLRTDNGGECTSK